MSLIGQRIARPAAAGTPKAQALTPKEEQTVIGKSVAHYRITEELGQGGMGEVYRATDTRLRRDVALKVLPESFTKDAQRVARFRREAEVLASLNHSGIGAIYGLEESESNQVLVLELIEGEDLSQVIARGPVPLDESLRIAIQIAEALEAAHEKGIIHRDLKPANIKITREGQVKVLDFGLAKAATAAAEASPDLSASPTLSIQATQAGLILGTAAYMSPEQAKGLAADQRSDVWSFGAVLFEMLTGRQPFPGDDITEILASVVKVDLDWDSLPKRLPSALPKILRRCLVADPSQRYHAIADLRLDLVDLRDHPEPAESAPAQQVEQRGARVPLWAAALALILAFVGAWLLKPAPEPEAPGVIRMTVEVDEAYPWSAPLLSPDGKKLTYEREGSLWIRHFDRFDPERLPDTEGPRHPAFSPDSRFIAFQQDLKIWKLELATRTRSLICDLPDGLDRGRLGGLSWGGGGLIAFSTPTSLYEVSDRGGVPRLLLETENSDEFFTDPHFLPQSSGLLFVFHPGSGRQASVNLLIDGTRSAVAIPQELHGDVVFSPTGHLIYRTRGATASLYAVPFSISTMEIEGEPFLIDERGQWPSVSDDGTLSYWRGTVAGGRRQLVRLDRSGQVLDRIGQPRRGNVLPDLSPDGRWVVANGRDPNREDSDEIEVVLHDSKSGSLRRLASGPALSIFGPAWTASGDRVAFSRTIEGREEVWIRPADNSRPAEKFTDGAPGHFSRDGRYFVFTRQSEAGGARQDRLRDIWYLELEGNKEPKPFLATEFSEARPHLSPDGRWLAYTSDSSGQIEVYVTRFPSGEDVWRVSSGGGSWPRWSPKGDELFFRARSLELMVVAVHATEADLEFSAATSLPIRPSARYAVAEDGQSFIVSQQAVEEDFTPKIAIVRNWFEEFRNGR